MGAAHGGNMRRIGRGGKPIANSRTYHSPARRRQAGIILGRAPGNQQYNPRFASDCSGKAAVEPRVRGTQRFAVKVDRKIRRSLAKAKALIPTAVEGVL
jgi:hypothetical protein